MNRAKSIDVAINTMRARLTVLGFNLTIITFQISQIIHPVLDALEHGSVSLFRLTLGLALLMGAITTILALLAFISSARLNREGTAGIHLLLVGDLLMFLSLILTLFGFVSPYQKALDQLMGHAGHNEIVLIHDAVLWVATLVWVSTAYVAPIFLLLRAPVMLAVRIVYASVYLICLQGLTWLVLVASRIEQPGRLPTFSETFFSSLIAPLAW
ncbi:hypothetical protein C8N32_1373 [Rhodovulum imhoffii]|uniref:Uncharacterized protein n=1 Tax=Rhodovulum imhoffii TaxID=365340 RepID=A0A2T5BL42_9RHOB|nr:hypothetical protein [Rhodovulum imhoffii]PTM99697.1 hypothetical protein C8N32_1373 [Rhodovulum imhoffii]